jgi:large subunit ribosomal protein L30
MATKIKITQVKSGIGCPETQRLTLRGLGLNGPHKTVVREDTVSIRGMIRKISHLVTIAPAD